jgi:MmgE/PrpD C-terminal domain
MSPAYGKPYVKRHKNDSIDAEAICEAFTRPNMRFVATKTPEQQSSLTLHRTRHLFIRQQTSVINAIRAHLVEFGIVAPVGRNGVEQLLGVVADESDKRLPEVARACVTALGAQLQMLKAQILQFDRRIMAGQRSDPYRRGMTGPLDDPATFDPVRLQEPVLRNLCRRVEVVSDGRLSHADWTTKTIVTCRDGSVYDRTTEEFPGTPAMPLSRSDLEQRFHVMSTG